MSESIAARLSSWRNALRVYREPRAILILLLGFSCGLPFLLVFGTLSAWLREVGVSLEVIGWFSLASGAYAFKFVWAPAVDRLPLPILTKLLGQRRSWLILAQVVIAGAAIALGSMHPGDNLALTALLAVVLAFASATQDIVVDAYRIEIMEESQMGAGAATYVVGYRAATFASGAGALVIADAFGWFAAYATMGVLMVIGVAATLWGPEPKRPQADDDKSVGRFLRDGVVMPFVEFARRPYWWQILLFAALYKYGDALLGVMANPFYLDIGFSKTEIGLVTKGFGLAATLLGGVIGGAMVVRFGTLRALLIGGVLQGASNAVFALQAAVGAKLPMLFVTIGIENLTGGIGTIAFVAYLSGLCNVAYTATQYALLSSAMALARTFLAAGGGWLAERLDWVMYFLLTGLAAVPGLVLLLWLMKRLTLPTPTTLPSEPD